ncbi:MAG: hypothetical protein IJ679_07885 [Lachnospiraceae bacterium]|nr:hypothetical protein [Lachnospiraceae bacterium]
MTQKETTNIILKLNEEGWSAKKITAFLTYVAMHNPTEEEVVSIIDQGKEED